MVSPANGELSNLATTERQIYTGFEHLQKLQLAGQHAYRPADRRRGLKIFRIAPYQSHDGIGIGLHMYVYRSIMCNYGWQQARQ
jgi:hypothetical protein